MKPILKIVDRLQTLNRLLSGAIESIGVLCLMLIMVITALDVVGAKAFLKPVPGALDIVTLAQAVAISFCSAALLMAGGHVSVEFCVNHLPPPARRWTAVAIDALSLVLCGIIVWRMWVFGTDLRLEGEVSPTARIPLYPVAFGIVVATVPACIELFLRIVRSVFGRAGHLEC